jgi:hypothetical protein
MPLHVLESGNWGYLQLGLVPLGFGALQVWWFGSLFPSRALPKPPSASEFRRILERSWPRGNQG